MENETSSARYNIFTLFLMAFLFKFGGAVASDVGSAKAQSSYILPGGSFGSIGDMPATCDSVSHLGSPFTSNLRVTVLEDNITRRSLAGMWIPLYFLYRSDTTSMLSTKSNLSDSSSMMRSMMASVSSTRVKYTDTAAMLAPYLRSVPAQSFASLTGKPTTLSGYGITDATSNARSAITLTTTGSGAATYNGTTGVLNVPTPVGTTYSAGTGLSLVGSTFNNTAPDQTVTLTAGRGIAIAGTYPNFTISLVTPTTSIASRSLNSNFTINTTKEAIVSYSITCSVTNPLLAGSSTATVYLEYSTNSGSTWQLPAQNGNSSAVGVAVAIAITNSQTVTVAGTIPANALVRLRTATTGTASTTYVTGQETVY